MGVEPASQESVVPKPIRAEARSESFQTSRPEMIPHNPAYDVFLPSESESVDRSSLKTSDLKLQQMSNVSFL